MVAWAGDEGEGQEQEQDIRRIGEEAGVCDEAGAGYCQQMASCYWSSELKKKKIGPKKLTEQKRKNTSVIACNCIIEKPF